MKAETGNPADWLFIKRGLSLTSPYLHTIGIHSSPPLRVSYAVVSEKGRAVTVQRQPKSTAHIPTTTQDSEHNTCAVLALEFRTEFHQNN